VIFVDSNIPMYLVGTAYPHKWDARRLLEQLLSDRRRLVTDAEVLQEILHRYSAIGRLDAVQPCFDALLGVVDEVFPIEQADVQDAKDLLLGVRGISSRDALHAAVMRRREVDRILTFDRGFDAIPGVERV